MVTQPKSAAQTCSLAMAIGGFARRMNAASLRPNERLVLKQAIMDCLAAAFAGAREPVTVAALALQRQYLGGENGSSVIGDNRRCIAVGAAFVNGTMAHACDFDDVSETMYGHPSAPALPAILALAETRRSSGQEVLAALAAAMETMMKLGRVAGIEVFRSGWHPTATLGVFGATVGSCRILGLDEARTACAIGIAASRASGLRCNIGTMVKPLHAGFAARDGVEAALLSEAGASASMLSLEGPFGFFSSLAPGHGDIEGFARSLGNPFDFVEPGVILKKYPSCLDTHAAIDAVLSIREENRLEGGDALEITCYLPPGIGGDLVYSNPRTPLEGKFSLEFCIAVALVRGKVTTAEFVQEILDDPDVRGVMRITSVRYDPKLELPAGSFCGGARVEILTRNCDRLSNYTEYMTGHPRTPMDSSELRQKLVDCARDIMPASRIRRLIDMIDKFEDIDDVSAFCKMLASY